MHARAIFIDGVSGILQLITGPVINHNLFGGDAGRLQAVSDGHDKRHVGIFDAARNGVDFNSDFLSRVEESFPGLDGVVDSG